MGNVAGEVQIFIKPGPYFPLNLIGFMNPVYRTRTRLVLFIIGMVYTSLGLWCTILPVETSSSLGFKFFDSGIVEYVVVYGGLEVGLGFPMLIASFKPVLFSGVYFMTTLFSLCLPVFRLFMIFSHGMTTTLVILFIIEIIIFISLVLANSSSRPRSA